VKFVPHDYQRDALEFLEEQRYAGLFADPGLGKTAVVLHFLERLWWRSGCTLRVLLIAPKRVIYTVWPEEIDKWDLLLPYSILHGKNKENRVGHETIDLLNVENTFWLLEDEQMPAYDLLVIDESSGYKGHDSKRLAALKPWIERFNRRIILTGTPSPNTLMDLYGQIYILDQGKALGKNITAFREKYFYPTGYRGFTEYNLIPGSEKLIPHKIAPMVMRIDGDTHLDLPPLVNHIIKVRLPANARRIYDDFERELFAELDGYADGMSLNSAVALYNVCRQIANGHFYRPPDPLERAKHVKNREIIPLHGVKIEALKELMGELQGKPLFTAYHFRHDLDQLRKAFGEKVPIIPSTDALDLLAIKRWNKRELLILCAHPQAIAYGVNLQQGGNDIAWFALTDSLENYIQFNRRIYRQGVDDRVRIHHIIAENTVDEAIMMRLRNKDLSQRSLFQALLDYRKSRK